MPLADCILILKITRSPTDDAASSRRCSHCRWWPQCQENAFVQTSSPVTARTWATGALPPALARCSPAQTIPHHAGGRSPPHGRRRQERGGHGVVLRRDTGAQDVFIARQAAMPSLPLQAGTHYLYSSSQPRGARASCDADKYCFQDGN